MCLGNAQESFLTVSYISFTYQLAEYSGLTYRVRAIPTNAWWQQTQASFFCCLFQDQAYARRLAQMMVLQRLAQVAPGQPRMLAHDGFGARAFAFSNGFQHAPVLVLRHDQHVAGLG